MRKDACGPWYHAGESVAKGLARMPQPDRTLFHNGTIITMDDKRPTADAVLVETGRIAAVAGFADLSGQATAGCRQRDLGGLTLVPGFIDPHGHFPDSGVHALFKADLAPPPLGDCGTLGDALGRLASKAAETAPGEWVIGVQFDPAAIPEKRYPTRDELDRVSSAHPVWLHHFTGHAGVANSLALAWRGVDEGTPDPPGGRLGRCGRTGRLDGLLEGMSAMGDLGDSEFQLTRKAFHAAAGHASAEYYANGVTLAQNAWAPETLLRHFCDLADDPVPGLIDIVVLPAGKLEPDLSSGGLGFILPESRKVTFGPRKLFGDGSLHIQTACLSEPYFAPLNGDPDFRCEPAISVESMREEILPLHRAGHQIHVHANGDATAEIVLDAIELALEAHPREDHRHTLIHAQTLTERQLRRMARLGVSASFFPAHINYWGDFHAAVSLGPERAGNMSPARWAAECGVRFTIHNDAPVTPTRPLHLMWCATSRTTASGKVLGAHQRLTPYESLKAHTIDAAWQVFQERERGSIEPGKRADFTILSENPLECACPMRDIEVLETVVLGETAYRKDGDAGLRGRHRPS